MARFRRSVQRRCQSVGRAIGIGMGADPVGDERLQCMERTLLDTWCRVDELLPPMHRLGVAIVFDGLRAVPVGNVSGAVMRLENARRLLKEVAA